MGGYVLGVFEQVKKIARVFPRRLGRSGTIRKGASSFLLIIPPFSEKTNFFVSSLEQLKICHF